MYPGQILRFGREVGLFVSKEPSSPAPYMARRP
jgi:hypothetical protein